MRKITAPIELKRDEPSITCVYDGFSKTEYGKCIYYDANGRAYELMVRPLKPKETRYTFIPIPFANKKWAK